MDPVEIVLHHVGNQTEYKNGLLWYSLGSKVCLHYKPVCAHACVGMGRWMGACRGVSAYV